MADASPTSDGACQKNKKRKYSNAKRASDKARSKTRVNLGLAFVRWRQMKFAFGLKSDAELATFLLDRYEKGPSTSTPSKRMSVFIAPGSTIGGGSASDRDMEKFEDILPLTEENYDECLEKR
ncbi:unnamed protein product [Leuciscus chuanchicus]